MRENVAANEAGDRLEREDLARLTLPEIAKAVAAGSVRVDDAEAEMRRRPSSEPPRHAPRRARNPTAPSRDDLLQAMAETRRELRHTTQKLAELGRRLDALEQLALRSEPSRPPMRRVAARPPEPLLFDDEAA